MESVYETFILQPTQTTNVTDNTDNGKVLRQPLCMDTLSQCEDDIIQHIFSDEGIFHMVAKFHHSVRFWDSET